MSKTAQQIAAEAAKAGAEKRAVEEAAAREAARLEAEAKAAEEAAKSKTVKARVLKDCQYGKCNDVIVESPAVIKAGKKDGVMDDDAAAVAFAESLK